MCYAVTTCFKCGLDKGANAWTEDCWWTGGACASCDQGDV